MRFILSLISNPADPLLDEALVAEIRALLAEPGEPIWLAPGIAAEVEIVAGDPADARVTEARIRSALAARPIDIAILPATDRRKKLLLADMDSTIIGQECIDELAAYAGIKAEVAAITQRAMLGELPFEEALRERVALLKGVPAAVIDEILADRISVNPGAETLVKTMRAHGAHTALVSGGFTRFTGPVSEQVGFEEHFANVVVIENGVIAGRAEEPVRGRAAKLDALTSLRERFELAPAETMAVGDGANDLGMIEAAGLGVAYHAKPAVAAAADARIDHGDLTALLYLQGYRQDEFVT
jgi:phosphoserine phosphatase